MVVAVAVAAVLLTGVDRVMLGVHYPSDVVAGVVLGCAAAGGTKAAAMAARASSMRMERRASGKEQ